MKATTQIQFLSAAGSYVFSRRKNLTRDFFYTCLIMLMTVLIAKAQPSYVWSKQFSGPSNVMGNSIVLDDSGNVYTTGTFEGTVDFDPGPGTYTLAAAGASDLYISKLNSNGNFVWCKQISGGGAVANCISVDGTKNIYITGSFNGTTDFDPGFLVSNLISTTPSAFICKFSPAGGFMWAKKIGGSTGFTNGVSIVTNKEGRVWVTGYFSDTTDVNPDTATVNLIASGPRDIFVTRLSVLGDFEWGIRLGGDGVDAPADIAVDKSKNVILTGGFSDTADFDPGSATFNLFSKGLLDIFVCKLDSVGGFIWAKAMGGSLSDAGMSVAIDNCDNVYTTGIFEGSADFDPSNNSSTMNSFGMTDIFINKLDKSGNLVWTKTAGSSGLEVGGAIMVDINGDVYVGGRFSNSVDFDPGAGTTTLTSAGLEDCFISKYDALGEFLCAGSMGGTGTDVLSSMFVNSKDHVFSTGYFSNTADFDPTSAAADLTVSGAYDAFVSRLGPGSCCNAIPDPVDAIANSNSICMGESTKLNVVPAEMGTCPTWYWYEDNCGGGGPVAGGDTITLSPATTTTYFVRAEGACDTTNCKQVTVTVKPKPTAYFYPNVELTCENIQITFDNYSTNADQYFWVFTGGQVSVMQNPKHTFEYDEVVSVELTAIHASGCKDTYSWSNNFYGFQYNFKIDVPNIFTPNGDGVNDEFTMKYDGSIADCFNITIYDRWGGEMFSSDSPDFRWNGKTGLGSKAKQGTYFWVIQIQDEKFEGYLMLAE